MPEPTLQAIAFTIELPVPPSANVMWRHVRARSRAYYSKEYREWAEVARLLIRRQLAREAIAPFTGRVSVNIEVGAEKVIVRVIGDYGPRVPARRDIDNYAKPILDALGGLAFDDDRQVARLVIERKGWRDERDV